jgi:hypothetical protein
MCPDALALVPRPHCPPPPDPVGWRTPPRPVDPRCRTEPRSGGRASAPRNLPRAPRRCPRGPCRLYCAPSLCALTSQRVASPPACLSPAVHTSAPVRHTVVVLLIAEAAGPLLRRA